MITFSPENYRFPRSVDELMATLATEGDSARIVAGGTTIHELAYRKGMGGVRTLLDITRLPLDGISTTESAMRVGATATFTDLAHHIAASQPRRLAIITDAISGIRPMQVRNVGTVGGSICSSLPFFDLPTALVALDATATAQRVEGRRQVPLEEFFWDFFLPDLHYGELLTTIEFDIPDEHSSGAFQKFETNSVDWALVSVGVQLTRRHGKFEKVRVALGGGIGRKAVRARSVERALEGNEVAADVIGAAAREVSADVKAFNDFRGSAEFRTHLLRVYIARCIDEALSRTL